MSGAARYILLTLLSLLSLVLCLGTVGLIARSFWICDSYRPAGADGLVVYQSIRGALHYVNVTPHKLAQSDQKYPKVGRSSVPAQNALLWQEWNGPPRASYTALGFAYANSLHAYTIAAIPYWPLAVLFAILPVWSAPAIVRWYSKVPIHCTRCGKKVRGLVTKCPRCGHTIVETVAPPPPIKEAPPPPRPSKKVRAVVIKTAKPDRSRSRPTDGSDRSA